jgi:hypothetical protein
MTADFLTAAEQVALGMASRAERGADEIGQAYAGLSALARGTGCPKISAVAEEIGRFVGMLRGLEVADDGPLGVPVEVVAVLRDYAAEIAAAGRKIVELMPPPEPPPSSYAAGFRDGLHRARLLGAVQLSQKQRRHGR